MNCGNFLDLETQLFWLIMLTVKLTVCCTICTIVPFFCRKESLFRYIKFGLYSTSEASRDSRNMCKIQLQGCYKCTSRGGNNTRDAAEWALRRYNGFIDEHWSCSPRKNGRWNLTTFEINKNSLNSLRCERKTRRCVAKSQTVKVRAKRPNYLYFATLVSCDDPTINGKEKISQIYTLEKLEVKEGNYW